MRFKTLEIQGFKSFPDKTVLEFDSRTTAIVGSNGNGKSNISDALRWVMGEQGAKTLRGSNMEDVIFYGTQSRKAMGFAKVALTIDNGDRKLPIDTDEVVITRKLYRSGESEYLINGTKSRLKDIGQLFMGTGLGRDGYSIIGQGRIDEVVNSKAASRRELFEEAAGVSKFLHKKNQAERELDKTQENLLRLLDIETELQARIPVLEKQAEKAKKAFALKEEERAVGVALSVHELQRISTDVEEIENSVLLNQGECEHFEREITELEAEVDKVSSDKQENAAKRDRQSRQNESDRADIAETDKAIAVMKGEVSHNNGQISSIENQIKLSEQSGDETLEQIKDLKEKIENINEEIAGIERSRVDESNSLGKLEAENSSLDTENRSLADEIGKLYTAKSAAEIYISRAQENIEDLEKQLESAQSIIDGQADEKNELQEKKSELKKELDELIENQEETSNKLSGYSRLYESKATKLDNSRGELEGIRQEYNKTKTRLDVLTDVENSMAGYHHSVKSVMSATKSGRFNKNDVIGIVGDVIKVEKEYSTAVETALGGALQHIIVSNESVAKRCMAFLKESKSGRATFLPLTSVKGNALAQESLYNEDGFIGLGHEIIKYNEQFSGIIRSLLGRTAFAEDIDCATVIAKKYGYKFKIVTLDGQVINAGGSFTGGSVKKTEGIISRKQELTDLQKKLQNLELEIEPAKARHDTLSAECAKMKLECEGMREALSNFSGEEMRLTAEFDGVSAMLNQFEEHLKNSQSTLDHCKTRIIEEQKIISSNNNELIKIASDLTEKEQSASEKSELLEELINRRREIADTISELNMQKITKSKDIENLNSQIENLTQAQLKAGEIREASLLEIAELENKNVLLEASIIEKQNDIKELEQTLTQSKEKIAELIKQGEMYEKRLTEIHSEIREKTEHKSKFSSALSASVERKSNLEKKAEEIKADLFDNYELTPSEAAALVVGCADPDTPPDSGDTPFDIKAARTKLIEIKKRLSSLGNVNFAAIEEFSDVSERYKLLSEQLTDVRKAKSELEKLIAELIGDIRQRFLESFNDISHHFSRIFTEIFGGGKATLELTDTEDVLNSGIEIYAAPPGKLVKSLMSLSGGEKALVAITLYFAILLHRPTPFCMLDEVDAALDEVNVVKYINYLSRYSDTTQLMMITHRRSTIEGCDVLYGVFMQEKGVSRLLKQEIED
jgi:chromosome segregation protein